MVSQTSARFSQLAARGLWGVICLGVGLAVLLSERTCQASCGDYVVLRGSHSSEEPETLGIPVPQKSPCDSPACRGEVPQLPVLPVTPSEGPTDKPLALLALSLTLAEGSPNCDWMTASEHARPGFRSPLQRPPSL